MRRKIHNIESCRKIVKKLGRMENLIVLDFGKLKKEWNVKRRKQCMLLEI